MERKRIIAAFGDIRGFRKWTLRALNSPEVSEGFIRDVYSNFEQFSQKTSNYVKYLGDGLLIVRELGNGHNCGTARQFLHEVHNLTVAIEDSIKGIWPRPDGFRARVACGYVWKRPTIKRWKGRNFNHAEYIGYAVNMAQALLYVYPEIQNICHESIVELIGPKKNGLVLERLAPPKERRHGVDPQDFNGLWRFGPGKHA
jgi:hypothetical protein